MKTALVLGGNGFIGHHMAQRLKESGYWVRVVDIKAYEYGHSVHGDEIIRADLRNEQAVKATIRNQYSGYSIMSHPFEVDNQFDEIYQFAADMGGCQFVFSGENDAEIMHNSAVINLHLLNALKEQGFKGKVFYSSSACMYPKELQQSLYLQEGDHPADYGFKNFSLRESDAYPANPDSEYGWEKLFSERLYLSYARNHGIDIRIARFHNIYGPEGTYKGGREKAPASVCRKVTEGDFNMWGDGSQTRSFLYIDDCVDAVRLLMESDFKEPINIGSEEMVTIRKLWDLAIEIRGNGELKEIPMPDKFMGVRGRNSDNNLIREVLNWEPKWSLLRGMYETYSWIKSQYA